MKTRMAATSLDAFDSLPVKDYLQPKEQIVLTALGFGPATRQELATRTGMPLCGVCGRVRSLLDKGAIEVRGTRRDPSTGKSQEVLRLTPLQLEIA